MGPLPARRIENKSVSCYDCLYLNVYQPSRFLFGVKHEIRGPLLLTRCPYPDLKFLAIMAFKFAITMTAMSVKRPLPHFLSPQL